MVERHKSVHKTVKTWQIKVMLSNANSLIMNLQGTNVQVSLLYVLITVYFHMMERSHKTVTTGVSNITNFYTHSFTNLNISLKT